VRQLYLIHIKDELAEEDNGMHVVSSSILVLQWSFRRSRLRRAFQRLGWKPVLGGSAEKEGTTEVSIIFRGARRARTKRGTKAPQRSALKNPRARWREPQVRRQMPQEAKLEATLRPLLTEQSGSKLIKIKMKKKKKRCPAQMIAAAELTNL
jgi:hypothetical protein